MTHQYSDEHQESTSCWQQTIWQSPQVHRAGRIIIYASLAAASVATLLTNDSNFSNIPVCPWAACWKEYNGPWECIYECPWYVNYATDGISYVTFTYAVLKTGVELFTPIDRLRSAYWHWRHRNDFAQIPASAPIINTDEMV